MEKSHYKNVEIVGDDVGEGFGHNLSHRHAVEAVESPLGFLRGLDLILPLLRLAVLGRLLRRSAPLLLHRRRS